MTGRTPTTTPRVVLAEDSVLLREGLVRLLSESGFTVSQACPDAGSFLTAVAEHRPDLVLLDVRMPPTFTDEGIRAALVIRQQYPGMAVMVLSQYVEENYATELIGGQTRGVGYLLKDRVADVSEFVDALHRVLAGGTALDPEVIRQLFIRSRRSNPLERLTDREGQVLQLMAEGRSNTGISRALSITEGAVEKHISNIFTKLDLTPAGNDHRRVLAVLHWVSRTDG
jgi:DNA-binding NarL/FixJ family response regulator